MCGVPFLFLLFGATANAGVLLEVGNEGSGIRFAWTGTMDMKGASVDQAPNFSQDRILDNSRQVTSVSGQFYRDEKVGTVNAANQFLPGLGHSLTNFNSNGTGLDFGFFNGGIMFVAALERPNDTAPAEDPIGEPMRL